MRCRRIRGPFSRQNAIGETNPAVCVACQVEPRIFRLPGLDPGHALGMTEEVLRHATRPAANPGQRGGSSYAKSGGDFLGS